MTGYGTSATCGDSVTLITLNAFQSLDFHRLFGTRTKFDDRIATVDSLEVEARGLLEIDRGRVQLLLRQHIGDSDVVDGARSRRRIAVR